MFQRCFYGEYTSAPALLQIHKSFPPNNLRYLTGSNRSSNFCAFPNLGHMAYTLCIIKCKGGISMEQLEKIAAFTAGFHLEDAPEAVVEAAKACVLDTVSVAIGAGSNQMYCGIKQASPYTIS